MRAIRRPFMWLLVWALAGALLVASGRARAQGVVPTPEQLEIFQSLPREQQEAILRQMAGGGFPVPLVTAAVRETASAMTRIWTVSPGLAGATWRSNP